MLGFFGGGTADPNLYGSVASGGAYEFRVNNVAVFTQSATLTTLAGELRVGGSVNAAWGTYGSYTTPAIAIGDAGYGFYVSSGHLRLKTGNSFFVRKGDDSTDVFQVDAANGNLSAAGNLRLSGNLGVGNSAAATVAVGALANKIEIFNAAGVSLGFLPVYASIT